MEKNMGPLDGYTILELAGIGPAPMAGMILADMGARVIRVERMNAPDPRSTMDVSFRGKKSLAVNLKDPQGVETVLRMVEKADVLIDPYRPGVCEKLGLAPEICLLRNPRLIFGRMTGWGQEGPLAKTAGHDINFISLTGALFANGRRDDKPVPPLNLIGDMGGGGMLLVSGILAALLERVRSNKGQVIDAAMVDGAAQLMWMFHGFHAAGMWDGSRREVNIVDGGAHFYNTYECSDGKFVSIGCIEPQFYALLMQLADLPVAQFENQNDQSLWPEMQTGLTAIFKQKTQAQWCEIMEGTDVCFAPVLSFVEAPQHPANKARNAYIEVDGITQPAPAPRFSRTPANVAHGAHGIGQDTDQILGEMGFAEPLVASLRASGVIG
jgi:alpha-methylacyl-CoA racemase